MLRVIIISASLFFIANCLSAQTENPEAIYLQQMQEAIANGKYPLEQCSYNHKGTTIDSEVDAEKMICTIIADGFGTNGWQPTSGDACNRDPSCDVPAVPNAMCNGGKYRVPLAITIFECSTWTGQNYNNNTAIGGSNNATGFIAISDAAINATLASVNQQYANANIEYYEVQRQRVDDCDIYDFYGAADPLTGGNDGLDDLIETEAFDLPNVINLYFVGGLEGDHDCCGVQGFAPFPLSRDYSIMRYPPAIGGTTIAHELGHYLGLFHTQSELPTTFNDVDGFPSGALDNSDCLTTGDGICDTWPDPNLAHNCDHSNATYDPCYVTGCNYNAAGFAAHAHGASTTLSIDLDDGTDCIAQTGVSTILTQNIMSANNLFGCRTDFSYCQYRKMHDIITDDGCRSYLCNDDPTQYFASTVLGGATSPFKEICVGDAIPTFNAGRTYTGFDGVAYDIDCFDWYLGQNDMKANSIATNVATFTPTAAQVDVNTPGVYSFWIAEVNNINDPPCKSKVTIIVQPEAGNSTVVVNSPTSTTRNACYDTDITSLPEGKVIGWWVTDTNPITSMVNNTTTFNTALANATIGGTLTSPANHIFESTGGVDVINDYCLDIDCTLFPEQTNIYATPLVTCSSPLEPATDCSASATSFPVSVSGNLGAVTGLVDFATAACPTDHNGIPSWEVKLTINNYIGGTGVLNLNMRGNNACTNANFLFFDGFSSVSNGSVFTFTEADFPTGYDPTQPGSEICALVWDSGSTVGDLEVTLEVIKTYAEVPAVVFPTGDFSSCFFGTPALVVCSTSLPIELVGFNGRLQNEKVLLDWQTETEINNAHFLVEKSTDGRNFEFLEKVEGQGTSYEKHNYQITDSNPYAGTNYYRLTQIDFDAQETVVGIISVNVLKTKTVEIYPNPIQNNTLAFDYTTEEEGQLDFSILDITGKLIINQTISVEEGSNVQNIGLGDLTNGIYFVVTTQNEKIITKRFTKLD